MGVAETASAYVVSAFNFLTHDSYTSNTPLSTEKVAECLHTLQTARISFNCCITLLIICLRSPWRYSTRSEAIVGFLVVSFEYFFPLLTLICIVIGRESLKGPHETGHSEGYAGEVGAMAALAGAAYKGTAVYGPVLFLYLFFGPWFYRIALQRDR